MRDLLIKTVLFGVSIIITILAAEIVVRYLELAPRILTVSEGRYRLSKNPLLGYEPTPRLNYSGSELYNYDWHGEESESGFRSREYRKTSDSSTKRIAVLGDSLAAGLWIEKYEDTFPAVLEAELNSKGLSVHLQNYGLIGYNTRQEIEALKDFALRFEPHIVVLEYCLNDRERSDGLLLQRLLDKENNLSGISPVSASSLTNGSALARWLRFRVLPRLGLRLNTPSIDDRRNILTSDSVDEALREFGQISAKHGFLGVVAIFPRFGDLINYAYLSEHQAVRSTAERAGLKVIDLLDAFRQCEKNGTAQQYFDEYHPNIDGHRCAGKALASGVSDFITHDDS